MLLTLCRPDICNLTLCPPAVSAMLTLCPLAVDATLTLCPPGVNATLTLCPPGAAGDQAGAACPPAHLMQLDLGRLHRRGKR